MAVVDLDLHQGVIAQLHLSSEEKYGDVIEASACCPLLSCTALT
jgi:hypothetical protein